MTFRNLRTFLIGTLLLSASLPAIAGDGTGGQPEPLSAAYASVLRGDYQTAKAALTRLADSTAAAEQLDHWLDGYHAVVASRNELKAETHAWNVEQAQQALTEGRNFLALSFAAQAAPYADDLDAYARQPWVQQLNAACRADAVKWEENGNWSKALSHYVLLSRIYKDDKELDELRERAARHARVDMLYDDAETLAERLSNVDKGLLRSSVKMIERLYFRDPDFKKMAGGALDNLVTIAGSHKLRELLDGLANPALRDYFVRHVEELRSEVAAAEEYNYKDLLRLFNRIALLNQESIEVPEELLVVEFLEGVLSELDDYTDVIWPVDARDFDRMMMGSFQGVGIQLSVDERSNRLKVVTPLENSPALEAGIQPEDIIIAVDGESTKGWSTDDAVKNITGPAGTAVVLTMFRPSTGERIPFRLVRQRIVQTTVRGVERIPGAPNKWNYMLDEDAGVAYIRLRHFHYDSQNELFEALNDAKAQGMSGLILDIRHNPGGLLDVAVDIVSAFLEKGDVVSTRGRLEAERMERVAGHALYKDVPLVVLVNEGSASGSEILAGALQDHDRAIVLGHRTFGKGSVQHVRPLSDEARFKLTTALYYLPSGRTPHRADDADTWGVNPDWELELTPKEFRKVIERENERYIIHNESDGPTLSDAEREKLLAEFKDDGADDDDEPPLLSEADIELLESDPYEAPESDPQLETALLLLRVKLAANVPWPQDLAVAVHDAK
jgi:carboxyl-terminal processing protease